jgi:gamma-glutamyltranspeptidase
MPDTATFPRAAVAAPHRLAAETGRAVLAEGGDAVEAMIAMAATIAVVYPHMNAIGGDGFWLIREPGGKVRGIEACGPAGSLATIKRYRDKGYDAIPGRGPDVTVTVAGAVGGWQAAFEYARSRGARLPLATLLADAIRFAREGCPISQSEARGKPNEPEALHGAPGFAKTFLVDDKTPAVGTIRKLSALAETLEQLAQAGFDDFYRGDVGREIAADLELIGSPVTRGDLERFRARFVEPLSAGLERATVFAFPPPTQGLAALLILGIYERLNVTRIDSIEHHHALVEAVKRAFAIRDRVVTDPDRLRHIPDDFLTSQAFERESAKIDMRCAAPFPLAPAAGDTIWMGAIDGDGLAVSYIQSLYWEWGSGCVLPRTGIHWQNRGASFSLDPNAVNPLAPGRKPFHTLIPALAALDDGRVIAYGSMGGDGQPQFQAQIFTRYLAGMEVGDAVDAPRWLLGRTWGETSTTLKMESRFEASLMEGLARMGHDVEELGVPYSETCGHAGMLVKHPRDGRVEAAHDQRSDGGAAGL